MTRSWARQMRKVAYESLRRGVEASSRFHLGTRLPILRKLYWQLQRALKPTHVRIAGYWIEVHRHDIAITDALLKNGVYESFETDLVKLALRPGMTFVD